MGQGECCMLACFDQSQDIMMLFETLVADKVRDVKKC